MPSFATWVVTPTPPTYPPPPQKKKKKKKKERKELYIFVLVIRLLNDALITLTRSLNLHGSVARFGGGNGERFIPLSTVPQLRWVCQYYAANLLQSSTSLLAQTEKPNRQYA